MAWFIALLGASIFSSILVLAAGILSSRVNRREGGIETYLSEAADLPKGVPQATE
jgi:hypothetical protein